ncbi:MAG: CRISPR-associated ring nuclease Csm6 [Syntrophales bacterium]|nr:CRISPR-associated ring nuclease Csm6 [Syntrophales bacterium]
MKRILLAVCGLSPQVITETLYALHQEGRMVNAVRIITTREGKAAINAHLLSPEDGQYYRFLKEYDIDRHAIDFAPRHVVAVSDDAGREIDDISGEEDNELFLQVCMEQAFELTSHQDAAVYFSIAGGRKTMGACLAVAAQCYGRAQDRIYHVLVSPEFESNRDFFYPPRTSAPVMLRDREGQPYQKEARYARVTLIPMPFFSIRDRLSGRMLKEPEEPASLMLSIVREQRPELVIDLPARKVIWKGMEMDMMPARLALYTFFALRKKEGNCNRKSCRGCVDCFLSGVEVLDRQAEITALYRRIPGGREIEEMSDSGVASLSAENFNMYRSKLNRDLERSFGAHDLQALEVASRGRKPGARYGLALDRERIRVVM